MIDTSKLLLSITLGGILLGAGLSRYASPQMNAAPEAEWRERYRPAYSDSAMQYVDAGPIDASPLLPWPGAPAGAYQAALFQADYASDPIEDYGETEFADPYDDTAASHPDAAPSLPVEEAGDRAAAVAARLEATEIAAPNLNRLVSPNNSPSGSSTPANGGTNAL